MTVQEPAGRVSAGARTTRIPLVSPDNLDPDQELVYEQIMAGPRTELVGPLRAVLNVPELASRWQHFGEYLRFSTSLPMRLNELAILVTARRWNAVLEWEIHARAALAAGLTEAVLDRIRLCQDPEFTHEDEHEVYEFARALQLHGDVPDSIYRQVWSRWGTTGAVELSSVIGYYTLVAMTLKVHDVPAPASDVATIPLPDPDEQGQRPLSTIPASSLHRHPRQPGETQDTDVSRRTHG